MGRKISAGKVSKVGNTKTLEPEEKEVKKQVNKAINWSFVFNNYTEDDILIISAKFKEECKMWIFECEIGEEGTPHLQGFIKLKEKMRPTELKLNKKIHWELCGGDEIDNLKYCSKDYRKNDKVRIFKSDNVIIPCDVVKVIKEFRPFQKELLDIILGPVNEGKIIWVYDEEGQLGKTEFLRYCNVEYGIPFTYGGKCADIVNLAFNNKKYLLNTNRACMLYNFGRETENDKISYKSMEQIADGAISNTKFETGCFVCNKPHVVVLANCMPLIEKMTKSRWIVKYITKDLKLGDIEI